MIASFSALKTLQVFLSKEVGLEGAAEGPGNRRQTYSAAVRSGNETQDIQLESELDWAAVRGIVTDVVDRTLTSPEAP